MCARLYYVENLKWQTQIYFYDYHYISEKRNIEIKEKKEEKNPIGVLWFDGWSLMSR